MIKLRWGKDWIDYESVEWSGTDNQCSRSLRFSIPCNPYDKRFKNYSINLGDLIYLYDGKNQLFCGTITSREKTAEIGVAAYTAMDFMHHLLRSSGTYKFMNMTPEKITKKVCADLKIKTKELARTKANIRKIIFDNQPIYDIIVRVYRCAKATTKKLYMPKMIGSYVSVIEKGLDSGVILKQGVDITNATYADTTDNMVNVVNIYNESMKKLGQVKAKKNVEKYGVYQSIYTKEQGVSASAKAKSLLVGITQEASVEAIGNLKAISGYSIEIQDQATGLKGKFYITSDTHTFSNGVHTMSLGLSWKNEMEEGADSTEESGKKEITNDSKCYYMDNATVYHSSKSCSACKNKNPKETTVAEIKKIKITKGKNKGKRKYKPCAKCWIE